jgi:hypothetical protein
LCPRGRSRFKAKRRNTLGLIVLLALIAFDELIGGTTVRLPLDKVVLMNY